MNTFGLILYQEVFEVNVGRVSNCDEGISGDSGGWGTGSSSGSVWKEESTRVNVRGDVNDEETACDGPNHDPPSIGSRPTESP